MTRWSRTTFRFGIGVVVLGALLNAGCDAPRANAAPPAPDVVWRSMGAWSGRGNTQTESFTSDSGSMRIGWTTAKGAGTFRLTIHSAISGRPLIEAVDQRGAGAGTAFVHEDPRVFYAVVDSTDLDWSFTLQEAVLVERKRP